MPGLVRAPAGMMKGGVVLGGLALAGSVVWTAPTAPLTIDVNSVFNQRLWTGSSSVTTHTTGLDMSTHGGMDWFKQRANYRDWFFYDTERPSNNWLSSSSQSVGTGHTITRSTTGFTVGGTQPSATSLKNLTSYNSFHFRNSERFFQVLTWTGDGQSNRDVPHQLNAEVGFAVYRSTGVDYWEVRHHSFPTKFGFWGRGFSPETLVDENPSYPQYRFHKTHIAVPWWGNEVGKNYIAYIWAHDPEPNGIIQCGSVVMDGNGGATVNLGWQPQFILHRRIDNYDWNIQCDTISGNDIGAGRLYPEFKGDAQIFSGGYKSPTTTTTGFSFVDWDDAGSVTIYMAIRK